jgi:hypothetical protein
MFGAEPWGYGDHENFTAIQNAGLWVRRIDASSIARRIETSQG